MISSLFKGGRIVACGSGLGDGVGKDAGGMNPDCACSVRDLGPLCYHISNHDLDANNDLKSSRCLAGRHF